MIRTKRRLKKGKHTCTGNFDKVLLVGIKTKVKCWFVNLAQAPIKEGDR